MRTAGVMRGRLALFVYVQVWLMVWSVKGWPMSEPTMNFCRTRVAALSFSAKSKQGPVSAVDLSALS